MQAALGTFLCLQDVDFPRELLSISGATYC
jgi:hypothetical protein